MRKITKTDYVVGDEAEGGAKIGLILGSSPEFIAFLTPTGGLRWEVDDGRVPSHFPQCVARFDEFQAMIEASVPRESTKTGLRKSLGLALYGAVRSSDASSAMLQFDTIGKRIESAVAFHARVFYVASSLTSASVLVATLAAVWQFGRLGGFEAYALAAGAGCCGAAISVLLRSATILISVHSTPGEHFFSGASRTILGLLSGAALACVIQGNLLLGLAAANLPAMAALGLLAGFSERYLPRVLRALEEQSLGNASDEPREPPSR